MFSIRRLPAGFALASLFLPSLAAQTTTRVSLGPGGIQADGASRTPVLTPDARYVAFESTATNLVAGDTNGMTDVFVRDLVLGTNVRVSVDSAGVQANGASVNARISADGRYVAFESEATNLVAGDTNLSADVFVRDLLAGTTTRVDVSSGGVQANSDARMCSISADGRFVCFSSVASTLVSGDSNAVRDVFVRDLLTGQTVRASLSSGGLQANGHCHGGSLSADGRFVAFYSGATNLVGSDTNGILADVFLRDLVAGTTALVSSDVSGVQGNGPSLLPRLSPDGRYLAYESSATNLVGGDTNGRMDVFVRDLQTGATRRSSVSSAGVEANNDSDADSISADGRFVSFTSSASNLGNGSSGGPNCFVFDRVTGETVGVSVTPAGTAGNGTAGSSCLAAAGRFVVFESLASNLVSGDNNFTWDIFLRDRAIAPTTPFCLGDGTQSTACPCANNGAAGRGCANSSTSGGALLVISAFAACPDSATLTVGGLVPNALTLFLQGDAQIPGVVFGDGVRCVGGSSRRLYSVAATGTVARAPVPGYLPLGLQSAALGDPIVTGTSRWYQAWYRDADASFCAAPQGGLSNVSSGVRVDW